MRTFRDSLVWVVGQIENAFIEGVHVDEVLSFAMNSPQLGEYFNLQAEPSFVTTVFEAARRAAIAKRFRGKTDSE